MICEVTIGISGKYDIMVLSPQMIAKLIYKIRNSDTQEFVIPAQDLFSQGYVEYLSHVLEANGESVKSLSDKNAYGLIVDQMKELQYNKQDCFYYVKVKHSEGHPQFDVGTMEDFYIVTKEENSRFCYTFQREDGEESSILLEWFFEP